MQKLSLLCCRSRLASLVAPLLVAAACSPASATEEFVTEPPYRATPNAKDRLIVREDIAARLETRAASESDEAARMTGYGRMGFAKDAAYAVRVPFPSYVVRVFAMPGDAIKAGQALVELRSQDLARLRAEILRAQVQLRVRRQAVERLRPLVDDGTGSVRELAEAEAELEMAKAELASLEQSLSAVGIKDGKGDLYVLRASTGGSVVHRNIAVGERVSPEDDPAFLIGDPERLVVRAAFPERDVRWLRESARCWFSLQASGHEHHEGVLTRVLRAVDPKTQSAEAICTPKSGSDDFRAEMVARVEVEVSGKNRLLVPRKALLMKRDEWVAFVRTDKNVVERRRVLPGLSLGERVEVVEGLGVGDEVVIEGAVLLDGELDVLL